MSTEQKIVIGTITFSKTGTYRIHAEVEDSLRNVTQTQPISLTVRQSTTTPLSATLSVDRTNITEGQYVTFTIKASGGVPNYLASLKDANTGEILKVTQSFSSSTTVSLVFSTAGIYSIYAVVKDTENNRVTTNTVTITVARSTTPTTPSLSATLSVSKTNVKIGESFTFYVSISGGTAPYTVKIFRSDSRNSDINIFTYGPTYNTTVSYSYSLVLTDTYRFYATVTDGNGVTVKTDTVTVYVK